MARELTQPKLSIRGPLHPPKEAISLRRPAPPSRTRCSQSAMTSIGATPQPASSSGRPPRPAQKRLKRQTAPPQRLSFASRRMSCDFPVFRCEGAKLAFARDDLPQRLVSNHRPLDDDCDTDEEQILAATRQIKRDLEEGLDRVQEEQRRRRKNLQRSKSLSVAPRSYKR